MSALRKPQPVPRRDFLGTAALLTCGATIGLAVAGMARMPFPAVIAGEPSKIKAGRPEDMAVGQERWIPSARAFILRDDGGIYAISGVCTHLGCIVTRSPAGFACPCHGSHFGSQGEVIKGPAPSPLPWLEVFLASDGQLVLNTQSKVPAGAKLRV